MTSPLLLRNPLPHDPWKRNQLAVTVSAAFIFSGFSRVIPEGQRAAAFGLLSSFGMMGGAVGPLLGGLSVLINIRTVFFFDGLIYAGLSWGVWRSLCEENQNKSEGPTV